jgi:polyisoprenoid-binding protein YceI
MTSIRDTAGGASKATRLVSLCFLCFLCVSGLVEAQPLPELQKIIRERSAIRFATRQMNVPVEGQFRRFDGAVFFDPVKPSLAKAEFTVDLASIDLGNEEGETEVKRKLWLDTSAFPTAKFTATSIKPFGNNKFEAAGRLTIKGITHDVTAPFTITETNELRTVEGQFPLKRLQYKVGEGQWSDTDTVADEVVVRFRFTVPIR